MCQATSNNLLLCCRMPQNAFFPWTRDLQVSPKMTQTLFFFPCSIPFLWYFFATATVLAFVLLHNSRFSFHRYTQHEGTPSQKSARKWRCDLSWLLARKITKGIHLCKPASLNHPIKRVLILIWVLCVMISVICTIFSVCCQFNKKTGVGGTEGLGCLVSLDGGRCFWGVGGGRRLSKSQ